MYLLLTEAIINRTTSLPSGQQGYYYAENGSQSWKRITEEIGRVGKKESLFESDEVATIDLKEVADIFYGGDLRGAESILASKYVSKIPNRAWCYSQCLGCLTELLVIALESKQIVHVKPWVGVRNMAKTSSWKRSAEY
jgi:hypothetical protein